MASEKAAASAVAQCSMAVQPDGRIVLAGAFTNADFGWQGGQIFFQSRRVRRKSSAWLTE